MYCRAPGRRADVPAGRARIRWRAANGLCPRARIVQSSQWTRTCRIRRSFVATCGTPRPGNEVDDRVRYVAGGSADMPTVRRVPQPGAEHRFSARDELPVNDLSSGFRLYRGRPFHAAFTASNFDVLQQILVQAYAEGWRIREVPFAYAPASERAPRHAASKFVVGLPAYSLVALETAQFDPCRRLR